MNAELQIIGAYMRPRWTLGEWLKQVPAKYSADTVETIDALVEANPLCGGRSTMLRAIVEQMLEWLHEGIVVMQDGKFNRVPGVSCGHEIQGVQSGQGLLEFPRGAAQENGAADEGSDTKRPRRFSAINPRDMAVYEAETVAWGPPFLGQIRRMFASKFSTRRSA